jgi:ribosomal protein S18 acetylase RimI-like enzyme
VTVRPLAPADVDAVAEVDFAAFQDVALRHGLTPVVSAVRDSRAYVRRLHEVDPLGGFVADEAGRIVGHAWVHARGPIATVGPIAVEPAFQRRGIGRALLRQCIQSAGPRATQVRLVHESYNTASLGLYLSEGFRIVAPVLELVLDAASPGPTPATPLGVRIRTADPADHGRIVARDARPFGAPRASDVERLLRTGRAVVAERGTTLAGYALGGAGFLGSAAGEAPELVLALLATLASEPALRMSAQRAMILGTDRALVDGLRTMGFRLFRSCHYMIRGGGTAPPPGYVLMGGDYM